MKELLYSKLHAGSEDMMLCKHKYAPYLLTAYSLLIETTIKLQLW